MPGFTIKVFSNKSNVSMRLLCWFVLIVSFTKCNVAASVPYAIQTYEYDAVPTAPTDYRSSNYIQGYCHTTPGQCYYSELGTATPEQSVYTFTPEHDVICDVLIVAGGGGGGSREGYNPGGGGGAGEVLETTLPLSAGVTYTIKVGRGGNRQSANNAAGAGTNGFDSGIFIGDTVVKHCKGGGRGGFGRRHANYCVPNEEGGSGGGRGRSDCGVPNAASTKYNTDGN